MARRIFLAAADYPGGISVPHYSATVSGGVLIDVSITVDTEEVKALPEGAEDGAEAETVGWNATIEAVGCARKPTLENAMRQFGYAAERLGIELDENKVSAALSEALAKEAC